MNLAKREQAGLEGRQWGIQEPSAQLQGCPQPWLYAGTRVPPVHPRGEGTMRERSRGGSPSVPHGGAPGTRGKREFLAQGCCGGAVPWALCCGTDAWLGTASVGRGRAGQGGQPLPAAPAHSPLRISLRSSPELGAGPASSSSTQASLDWLGGLASILREAGRKEVKGTPTTRAALPGREWRGRALGGLLAPTMSLRRSAGRAG